MSETVYTEDSIHPTLKIWSKSLEVAVSGIHECSSTTTAHSVRLRTNHDDTDGLSSDDDNDDLPSISDILDWETNRRREIIDLTGDEDSSILSVHPSLASEPSTARTPMAPAPALTITPPQPKRPMQQSSPLMTPVPSAGSSVTPTLRRTLSPSLRTCSVNRGSDPPSRTVDADHRVRSGGEKRRALRCRPVLLEDIWETTSTNMDAPSSYSSTATSESAAGRLGPDTTSQSSKKTTDSVEIPVTPPATKELRYHEAPSVVGVKGKRLDTKRSQYLVLCWMDPREEHVANPDLARRCREYDERISRDVAQRERLSTLRSRKHTRTQDPQNAGQSRKKAKTNGATSTSDDRTCSSRQVGEYVFLDSDIHSASIVAI